MIFHLTSCNALIRFKSVVEAMDFVDEMTDELNDGRYKCSKDFLKAIHQRCSQFYTETGDDTEDNQVTLSCINLFERRVIFCPCL